MRLSLFVVISTVCAVTPVEKVLEMLTKLQTEVQEEGEAEAKEYDQVSADCQTMQAEKRASIEKAETTVDNLSGEVAATKTERDGKKDDVEENLGDIQAVEEDLAAEKTSFSEARAEYETQHEEVSNGVTGISRAIREVKRHQDGGSLVSVKQALSTVPRSAQALLQTKADSSSAGLLKMLNNLKDKFTASKNDLEKEHLKSKHAHESTMQGYQGELDALKTTVEDNRKQVNSLTNTASQMDNELSRANTTLVDDSDLLQKLNETCESKKDEYNQATEMRTTEMEAIGKALEVMKGEVAAVQTGARAPAVRKVVSLLQRVYDPRQRLVAALQAKEGLSKDLALVLKSARGDPFQKIKQLISGMIKRLMDQASEEGEQEGWCQKEIEGTKNKRNDQGERTAELSEEIHQMEARRNELRKANRTLTGKLATLEEQLTNATADREEDKAEHEKDVTDAEDGSAAVTRALEILTAVYKKENKKKESFLQMKGQVFRPNAVGVLDMLQQVKEDFDAAAEKTKKLEKEASNEFEHLNTTMRASIRRTEKSLTKTGKDLVKVKVELGDTLAKLRREQGLLNGAVKELEKLRAACTDEVDPEERRKAREDEIEALKQALCILNDPKGSMAC